MKKLCVPGMNCYSCPGAVGACPIGSLQNAVGNGTLRGLLYVCGFLVLFGTLLGRGVCGFLCPFGLIQRALHKIPFPKKLRRLPGEKFLRMIRYAMLLLFVLILPMFVSDAFGIGDPWFCKYVCPVGTLEAGIPLVLLNEGIRSLVGFLYAWKTAILIIIALLSVVIWRPFCRYLCPLGALYGFFNRFAIYRYTFDKDKCISCGACKEACKMDIEVMKSPNSVDCVRCGKCIDACPTGALGTVIPVKKKERQKTGDQ